MQYSNNNNFMDMFEQVYNSICAELNINIIHNIDFIEVIQRSNREDSTFFVMNQMKTGTFTNVFYKDSDGITCYNYLVAFDEPVFVIAGYLSTIDGSNDTPSDYYKECIIKLEIYNAIIRKNYQTRNYTESNRNNYNINEYNQIIANLVIQKNIVKNSINNLLNNFFI